MRSLLNDIRRNHALEHATVAVLLERGARPPLGGYSTRSGFLVFGRLEAQLIKESALDALARLNAGQEELAVSPFCGTTIVTRAVLSGLITSLIMGRKDGRIRRIPLLAVGLVGAALVSRPIGDALQRLYTTLSEPVGQHIVDVRRVWAGPFTIHRVRVSFE